MGSVRIGKQILTKSVPKTQNCQLRFLNIRTLSFDRQAHAPRRAGDDASRMLHIASI